MQNQNQTPLPLEDTPIGIAVRVGKLEEIQREWFPKISDQLTEISKNSATKGDIADIKGEIKELATKITSVEKDMNSKVDKSTLEEFKNRAVTKSEFKIGLATITIILSVTVAVVKIIGFLSN